MSTAESSEISLIYDVNTVKRQGRFKRLLKPRYKEMYLDFVVIDGNHLDFRISVKDNKLLFLNPASVVP